MMRRVGWVGMCLLGLGAESACTVPDLSTLGPFACDDSSSCASGYTCVRGQCVSNQSPAATDTTPPTLTLSVPSPQSKAPVGKTTYTEVGTDGKPLPPAWRRDEVVTVELRTDSTLALSVSLTGTDGQAVAVDVAPFTEGCDVPQCARAQLPLWKPRLDAARGALTFTATATDEAGNTTVQQASLPVTRWKWAYAAFDASDDNSVEATPAVGATGTLYVTTYNTTLSAVGPDGVELWSKPNGGEGTVVVGSPGDGREILYARGYWTSSRSGEGAQLVVYDAATAATSAPLTMCPSRVANLYIESYALAHPGTALEGVVAPIDGSVSGRLLGLSATANSGAPLCGSPAMSFKDAGRGNTVINGDAVFFSDTDGDAISVDASASSILARDGWPVDAASPDGPNGMAVMGDSLVMGEGDLGDASGIGGISTVSVNGGKATLRYLGGPVASPVVGQGSFAFGVDRKEGRLVRALLTASGVATLSSEASLDATLSPTLGQGGLVYAMFPTEVGAWSASDLKLQWRWGVGSVPDKARRVAPTLDCTRDAQGAPLPGRPGVLYVTLHNLVHALVVDSAGLDADAPWPKFQHDARNSGNPAVPVLRCP